MNLLQRNRLVRWPNPLAESIGDCALFGGYFHTKVERIIDHSMVAGGGAFGFSGGYTSWSTSRGASSGKYEEEWDVPYPCGPWAGQSLHEHSRTCSLLACVLWLLILLVITDQSNGYCSEFTLTGSISCASAQDQFQLPVGCRWDSSQSICHSVRDSGWLVFWSILQGVVGLLLCGVPMRGMRLYGLPICWLVQWPVGFYSLLYQATEVSWGFRVSVAAVDIVLWLLPVYTFGMQLRMLYDPPGSMVPTNRKCFHCLRLYVCICERPDEPTPLPGETIYEELELSQEDDFVSSYQQGPLGVPLPPPPPVPSDSNV